MKIFIEDSFDAAHWLPNVPESHKCHNMHGHTYRVHLDICGPLDYEMGWVVDYCDVKSYWNRLKDQLDHCELNKIDGLENPTCEFIAMWIWNQLKPNVPGLCRVELRETEKCGVVFEG